MREKINGSLPQCEYVHNLGESGILKLPLKVVVDRYLRFVLRGETRNGGKNTVLKLSPRACVHLVLLLHNVLQNTANHRKQIVRLCLHHTEHKQTSSIAGGKDIKRIKRTSNQLIGNSFHTRENSKSYIWYSIKQPKESLDSFNITTRVQDSFFLFCGRIIVCI